MIKLPTIQGHFFEGGAVGYSATTDTARLDGIKLVTQSWKVSAFEVTEVHSSFFSDPSHFPAGSVAFDCALVMRDIEHEWRAEPDLAI